VIKYVWPDDNATELTINIPEGTYSFEELSDFINFTQYEAGHYLLDENSDPVYYISLATNHVSYGVTFTLTPVPSVLPANYSNPSAFTLPTTDECPRIVIPAATGTASTPLGIGTLLGFSAGSYPDGVETVVSAFNSDLIPESSPISSINIVCNICDSGAFTVNDSVIKTFSPQVQSGEQVVIDSPNLIWFPCIESTFRSLDVQFLDGENRPVAVRDIQGLHIEILIRDSPK